jgi:DNA modification methylase
VIKLVSKKDQQEIKLKDYQINRGKLGIYDKRNQINDLTGKQWTFSTRSVKTKFYEDMYPENWLIKYPGILPVELIHDLFETFSKPNEVILDPLALLGNTLLASKCFESNRRFIYLNLQMDLFKELKKHSKFIESTRDNIGSIKLNQSVDLIFSQIILKNIINSKINFKNFINNIYKSLDIYINSIKYLINKKYALLSFSNWILRKEDKFGDIYFDTIKEIISKLEDVNLVPKGEIIWLQPYNSLSGLNETRILVMRKEE